MSTAAAAVVRAIAASVAGGRAPRGAPQKEGELAGAEKDGAAMMLHMQLYIVAVGVPSMTECSPTEPAVPSASTTS